jgi:hypothetical protein
LSTAGTQSEGDLPFSGLHRLLLRLLAGIGFVARSIRSVGRGPASFEFDA